MDSEQDEFELVEKLEVAELIVAEKKPDIPKITAWLTPTKYDSPSSEYKRHLSNRAPGTGGWIRETTQFKRWYTSAENGIIWIKGVPGAGKSVVAASMVDSLRKSEKAPVLFFFFRQIIEANRTSHSLLLDWLAQLLPHSEIAQLSLWEVMEKQLDPRAISKDQLENMLLAAISSLQRVYCVVDALDEMDYDSGFYSFLNIMGTFKPAQIKVLITSRPKQYLQSALKDSSVIYFALEEKLVNHDISVFVRSRTDDLPQNKSVQNSIFSTICGRAQGLFLYARLMLDEICQAAHSQRSDDADLLEMVSKIPSKLEDVYNRILQESSLTSNVSEEVQKLILQMVTQSARPVRLIEIAIVVGNSEQSSKSITDAKNLVRSACGPLLEIMEDDVVQILHHSFSEFLLDTSRANRSGDGRHQFPVIDPLEAHKSLWKICLAYIEQGIFTEAANHSSTANEHDRDPYSMLYSRSGVQNWHVVYNHHDTETFLKFPFANYATLNWSYHAQRSDSFDIEILQILDRFCDPGNGQFRACIDMMSRCGTIMLPQDSFTSLHIASGLGILSWVTCLLQRNSNVGLLDKSGHDALYWAARNGHEGVVKQLLESGANPNHDSPQDGLKPMHTAAFNNHVKVVKLLLAEGVSPTTPMVEVELPNSSYNSAFSPTDENLHDTPLTYATNAGHLECVSAMIPYLKYEDLQQCLLWAARDGQFQIFKLLLEISSFSIKPVPSSPRFGSSGPILEPWAENSFEEDLFSLTVNSLEPKSLRLLIDMVTKSPFLRSARGTTRAIPSSCLSKALHGLSRLSVHEPKESAWQSVFNILLKNGGDLEARDCYGNTPLLSTLKAASAIGLVEKLKFFISVHANFTASNSSGETLLHLACGKIPYFKDGSRAEVMRLILEHSAVLVDMRCVDGSTALHRLASGEDSGLAALKLLLDYNIDINAQDAQGNSFIHLVLKSPSLYDIAERINDFVSLGANINLKNRLGQTCAWTWNPSFGSNDPFDTLVQAGLDLTIVDNEGSSILHHLVTSNRYKAISHILKHCPKSLLNLQSYRRGKTALHQLCRNIQYTDDQLALAKDLIESGADPHKTDNNGNTLLHELAFVFRGTPNDVNLAHYLIDLGIPPDARNSRLQTAIHIMPRPISDNRSWGGNSLYDIFKSRGKEVNVDVKDIDGYSPLHYAAAISDRRTFELLEAGADYNSKSHTLRTPLHCAARGRRSEVIALILHFANIAGKDIEIDATDINDHSPLLDACRSGRPESVKLLIEGGACVPDEDESIFSEMKAPLTACSEFAAEDRIWQTNSMRYGNADRRHYDEFRPNGEPVIHSATKPFYWTDSRALIRHITARVGPIARMLIQQNPNLFMARNRALEAADQALVLEIRKEIDKSGLNIRPSMRADNIFKENLLLSSTRSISDLQGLEGLVSIEDPGVFLPSMTDPLMDALLSHGVDFCKFSKHVSARYCQAQTPIEAIAKLGLTELMEKIIDKAKLFDNKSYTERFMQDSQSYIPPRPLLFEACDTPVYNMDMIKLLVLGGSVNLNAQEVVSVDTRQHPGGTSGGYIKNRTILHVLSQGSLWWHLTAIKFLVRHGAEIDSLDASGNTPLLSACTDQHRQDGSFFRAQCLELLLNLGADPNHVNQAGESTLQLTKDNLKITKILLRHGADVNLGSRPMLWLAVEDGDVSNLQLYLESGADCNVPCSNTGRYSPEQAYPIILAATCDGEGYSYRPYHGRRTATKEEREKVFSLLIDHGARFDFEVTGRYSSASQPALHFIFKRAMPERLVPLLKRLAFDPNARNRDGDTVFLTACQWPGRFMRRLTQTTPPYLLLAESEHYRDTIDFCAVNYRGQNMFHLLAQANLNQLDQVPTNLPLDRRDFLNESDVQTLVQQKDKQGYSVLHEVLRQMPGVGLSKLCFDLIDGWGANLLEPFPGGATAIHYCIANLNGKGASDSVKIIQRYLKLGGSMNDTNNDGDTPFLDFLRFRPQPSTEFPRFSDYLDFFLKHGADILATNSKGETALHIVVGSYGSTDIEMFTELVNYGCNPLKEDQRGLTALDVATARGETAITDLFQRKKE